MSINEELLNNNSEFSSTNNTKCVIHKYKCSGIIGLDKYCKMLMPI